MNVFNNILSASKSTMNVFNNLLSASNSIVNIFKYLPLGVGCLLSCGAGREAEVAFGREGRGGTGGGPTSGGTLPGKSL